MESKTYIKKLLETTDENKRAEMADYMCELLRSLSDKAREDAERALYEMVEGKVLNEEKARHLISKMKPYGMKWELENTESLRVSNGFDDIRPVDFWIVMNSAYNDYEDIFKDNLEMYVKFSRDFIKDEDAVDSKVYYYFSMIPKKD